MVLCGRSRLVVSLSGWPREGLGPKEDDPRPAGTDANTRVLVKDATKLGNDAPRAGTIIGFCTYNNKLNKSTAAIEFPK